MQFSMAVTIVVLCACAAKLVTAGVIIAAPIASEITEKVSGDCALGVVTKLGCS